MFAGMRYSFALFDADLTRMMFAIGLLSCGFRLFRSFVSRSCGLNWFNNGFAPIEPGGERLQKACSGVEWVYPQLLNTYIHTTLQPYFLLSQGRWFPSSCSGDHSDPFPPDPLLNQFKASGSR